MKKASSIFLAAIGLLAFLLSAPSVGAANQVAVKGGEQYSPGVFPDQKVMRLADLPAEAREKILQHLRRAEYEVSTSEETLTSIQDAKLTASDGASNDQFGASVSISGDTIVVGARYDDSSRGSAYVFEKPVGGWADMTQTAKLTASDGVSSDQFGHSVAISGDTVVVGARAHDGFKGAAYVFEKPVGGWSDMTQTAKLTASDGEGTGVFGHSVAISGDTVVVGANGDDEPQMNRGSAYVFEKPVGGWSDMTQTAKLTASDGYLYDELGVSVSISGDTVVVGAHEDDGARGSAYVFEKPVAGWSDMTQTAKLTASGRALQDYFGHSVAISGDTVVVGAYGVDTTNGVTYFNVGRAYVFEEPVGGWSDMTESARLAASDGAANDEFGYSVSISGDTVLIGAWGGECSYFFEKPSGGWSNMTETEKLTASDGAPFDYFGVAVSISGDTSVVGAHLDDNNGSGSGSAYVFTAAQCLDEPVINDINFNSSISELCTSSITVDASDPCGGNLTYDWQALNGGVIIGSGESVEFDPPNSGPHPCPYQVEVTVTSDASALSTSQTLDISVKLAGDVNGDGYVNVLDKVLVRNSFGQSGDPGWIDEDLNCDGYVNVVDKVLVRNQFGETGCALPD